MPTNYREVDFEISGKAIKIAGMARPGFPCTNASKDIKFLADNHYTTIISLDPNPNDKKLAENSHPPIEYIEQNVEDFTPPSIELLEVIYARINAGVSTAGEKVCIHCGEGFGRTGTVLAALKLRELMMAIPANELVNEEATTTVDLGTNADKPGLFPCTPMVKRAIEAVRSYQGSGESVEKEGQVTRLNEYQSYLVEKLKKDYLSQTPDVFASVLGIRHAQALVKKTSGYLDNMSARVKQADILIETLKQTLAQASNQATSTDGLKNKLEQDMLSALSELKTANSLKKTADESANTLFYVISDAILIPIANFFRNILRLPCLLTYHDVSLEAASKVSKAQIRVDKVRFDLEKATSAAITAQESKNNAAAVLSEAEASKAQTVSLLIKVEKSKAKAVALLVAAQQSQAELGKKTLAVASTSAVPEQETSTVIDESEDSDKRNNFTINS